MNEPLPAALPCQGQSSALIGGAAIKDAIKAIAQAALHDVNVLILGESGTGKEHVARIIWQRSARAARPFVAVHCDAMPDSVLEGELFGIEGVATPDDRATSRRSLQHRSQRRGGVAGRVGRLDQCKGGVLFLDEVTDLNPLAQVKILELVVDKYFCRAGGTVPIPCDVRVIAATTKGNVADLDGLRRDLYYELRCIEIRLPPLRDHRADRRYRTRDP